MYTLSNSSVKIRIDNMNEIGLLGVFDVSDIVALSLSYIMIMSDPEVNPSGYH